MTIGVQSAGKRLKRNLTMLTSAKLGAAAALAWFGLLGQPALAADPWPTKPVTIYVPYAAGGAVDVLARTVGQSLSKA